MDSKLCTVDYHGEIKELYNITGPIVTPVSIAIQTIIQMINHSKKVYEVNPYNKSERILLTRANVLKVNFVNATTSYVSTTITDNSTLSTEESDALKNSATITTNIVSTKPEKLVQPDFFK